MYNIHMVYIYIYMCVMMGCSWLFTYSIMEYVYLTTYLIIIILWVIYHCLLVMIGDNAANDHPTDLSSPISSVPFHQ